ncbi:MAG: hypothetical protein F6K40_24970 [Okeania sp. SIO3I5]|nr:hypothetical protein [Okeania sp. SIO3I5]
MFFWQKIIDDLKNGILTIHSNFLYQIHLLQSYKKPGLWEVNISILGHLIQTRFLCFFYTGTTRFDITP